MWRKIMGTALVLCILSGCISVRETMDTKNGSGSAVTETAPAEYTEDMTEGSSSDKGVDIDARIEKEDNMIRMIISPEYFGINETEDAIKRQVRNWGANDISIDEQTGYVSAIMSQSSYDAFVLSLRDQVIDTVNKIKTDKEKYPSITDIQYSVDLSRFEIRCLDTITYEKSIAALELYMASASYQVLSGIPQEEAVVDIYFIDNVTDEVIEIINTSDLVGK